MIADFHSHSGRKWSALNFVKRDCKSNATVGGRDTCCEFRSKGASGNCFDLAALPIKQVAISIGTVAFAESQEICASHSLSDWDAVFLFFSESCI